MDLDELPEKEMNLKEGVKKNCMLCMGRAGLNRQLNPEKEQVQANLKQMYSLYEEKFNKLRKTDADASQIQGAAANKRFILDIISECESCDRTFEKAKRRMAELK